MAERMPTKLEMEQAFSGKGVQVTVQSVWGQLRDQEKSGRLMRDAAVQDNCTVQMVMECNFAEAEGGVLVSEWIDFGEMRFVREPAFTTGSRRMGFPDEKTLNREASNYDPLEHFSVPAAAMVLAYKTDDRGFYSAAKLLFFALASVSEDYRVKVSAVWIGPAVRKG